MQTYYVGRYRRAAIDERLVLFESRHGSDLDGNILRLIACMEESFRGKYRMYLSCIPSKKGFMRGRLAAYGLDKCTALVNPKSVRYFSLLARAKYLFNDTSFTGRYIKKSGQIIVNTWHGTPLKAMGRDDAMGAYAMGNIQRNLLMSDYIVLQGELMKQRMISAYMLDGIYKGTLLLAGLPRNEVFFRQKNAALAEKLRLGGKRVFAYMPTWRGQLGDIRNDEQAKRLTCCLRELDSLMNDDWVLLVKLHPFVGESLDFSQFSHIRDFFGSSDCCAYDTYEILALADCLITDYSSVMYDFANTAKSIILFAYDKDEYMSSRGLYGTLPDLPTAATAAELYSLMLETLQEQPDCDAYAQLAEKGCTYDRADSAEVILRRVLNGERLCDEASVFSGEKENVLFFAGALAKSGITTSLLNLFDNIDVSGRRYFVTFQEQALKSEPERAMLIPDSVGMLPMHTRPQYTLLEALAQFLMYKLNIGAKPVMSLIDRMCKREAYKLFGSVDFSCAVQFEGYGKNMIHLFKCFSCRRYIFVHNNMLHELKYKNIQNKATLKNAYKAYDAVACVTEDLEASTRELCREAEIRIVNNCHSYKSVAGRAAVPLEFDSDTLSTVGLSRLEEILSERTLKIITIGRFSAEKGHGMLIDAFCRFNREYPDSYLIIVGGYGELYEQTLEHAGNCSAHDSIAVIRSMRNPMPLLKRCDLFVLSSRYEGLGLTLLEADCLGIPVISTDVCGTSGFMKEHGGFLVRPDAQGLYEGMRAFRDGRVKPMNVDYEKYNTNAAQQFEELMKIHAECPSDGRL